MRRIPPMQAHLTQMGLVAEEELTTVVDVERPLESGVFINEGNESPQEEAARRIRVMSQDIRGAAGHLLNIVPLDMYDAVDQKRYPIFEQNKILLRHAVINVHDTGHQDRDAYMAFRVGEAFPEKINPDLLQAVVVASMIHDIAYQEAAYKFGYEQLTRVNADISAASPKMLKILREQRGYWSEFLQAVGDLGKGKIQTINRRWTQRPDTFPRQLDKVALDPHAPLGMETIRKWYEDPAMKSLFDQWTPEQKEAAALAIRDHSNGSDYDTFTTPLEAKLLRLADKLDNTYERVEDMLSAHTLEDDKNCHRYVPAANMAMELEIDKDQLEFRVRYIVDPSRVVEIMSQYDPDFMYDNRAHLHNDMQAYKKSYALAAEVVYSLFAEEGQHYNPNARFIVEYVFADGEVHEREFKPLGTNTAFNA